MTFEPGTADILTTCDPPFPGPSETVPQRTTLDCPYGWKIVLRFMDVYPRGCVMADLVHPWLGTVATGVYHL